MKWSFDISDSKTKLRITVLSKSVLLGAAQFSIQDLMDAVAEDEFVKRVRSFWLLFFHVLILFLVIGSNIEK